ncbi:major facilitator superfamily domain-containing protein [Melampsora americana]|nr:major facilitator superfamily domain-containing protein [Melampsora americana]
MNRKLVRKLDINTMPILSLLWLSCFIDRTNIGNAKIAGLEKDLGLKGIQFNIGLAVFFLTYVSSEIPSNLLIGRFGIKNWLAFLVCGWGIVTLCSAFMTNYISFIVTRLFLGLFEGGMLPGMVLYLSTLYRKDELQLRIGILISCVALGGAFSGLLAYGIQKMNGIRHQPGWAWVFILEGISTIVLSIIGWFILCPNIASAKFLDTAEKNFAANRLKIHCDVYRDRSHSWPRDSKQDSIPEDDRTAGQNLRFSNLTESPEPEHFEWAEVRRGLRDPQAWMTGFAVMSLLVELYSFSFFLPTLVRGMGYVGAQAQLFSSYPYLPAAGMVIIVALVSDKARIRGPLVLVLLPISVAGYIMACLSRSSRVRYASVFFMTMGIFPSLSCFLTILPNNSSGVTKRATTIAVQVMIGNLAGFVAPFVYTTAAHQGPRFLKGHTIALAFVCAAWSCTAANVLYCWKENIARKAGKRDHVAREYWKQRDQGATKSPIGDRDPTFLYTL